MQETSKYTLLELESDSSSDDDSIEDEQDNAQVNHFSDGVVPSGTNRDKRSAPWCAVGAERTHDRPQTRFPLIRRVVWPPPSTSQPFLRNAYLDPKNLRIGNPKLGNRMQLYCRTGFFLAVYPDGKVRGTKDEADEHTFLEIQTAGLLPEHVKIQGMLTRLYVAMDKKGRLYAEPDPNSPAAVFVESFHGSYNVYLSRNHAHLGWYLGVKKSGKFKKGPKTRLGQRAVKFLPRRTRFE